MDSLNPTGSKRRNAGSTIERSCLPRLSLGCEAVMWDAASDGSPREIATRAVRRFNFTANLANQNPSNERGEA